MYKQQNRAFTLVELAIVMVIIGMIVAAVIAGRDMIRQSKLASVVIDAEKYKSAIRNFEEKFSNLPGDMIDAGDYWAATANGNNNDIIELAESLRAWQHLSLAHFLQEPYSGTGNLSPDINFPKTAVSKIGGFLILNEAIHGRTDNAIIFAEITNPVTGTLENAIITQSEAWAIDTKYDDGAADTGMIMARDGTGIAAPNCLTGGTTYLLTDDTTKCRMNFWLEQP